ncbi:hypothetical protein HAX54_026636 [Datura stramonium]|uniref:Uncharacterized protein n=1 Tax=Datura stramonium TaxID=4076 RepID=A0ABS8V1F4_DATST|nr:hypothetical protein [Datura stramonium]
MGRKVVKGKGKACSSHIKEFNICDIDDNIKETRIHYHIVGKNVAKKSLWELNTFNNGNFRGCGVEKENVSVVRMLVKEGRGFIGGKSAIDRRFANWICDPSLGPLMLQVICVVSAIYLRYTVLHWQFAGVSAGQMLKIPAFCLFVT